MPLHPLGFFASVQTEDGNNFEEFKIENEDNKTTCYIACETGKRFQISVSDKRTPNVSEPPTDLNVKYFVDGEKMNGLVQRVNHIPCEHPIVSIGKSTSATSYLAYQFGEIKRSEEESECCSDEKVLKQLGSIMVEIYRGKQGIYLSHQAQVWARDGGAQKTFYEKSKKAAKISNQVELTNAIQSLPRSQVDFQYYDQTPYATFVFHYRSRALLELDGIAPETSPTPPSPSPSTTPENIKLSQMPKPKVEKSQQKDKKSNIGSSSAGTKRQIIDVDELDLDDNDLPSGSGSRKKRKSGVNFDLGNDGVEFTSAGRKGSKPLKTEKGSGGRDVILLD